MSDTILSTSSEGGNPERSVKTLHAQELQSSAKSVADRITRTNGMSNWSLPARTFPEAIAVMAAGLVAASDKRARVVQMKTTLSRGDDAGLPYSTIHANLQHCGDLGRVAFRDSQVRMESLHNIASYLIGGTGSIVRILELLNHPEDAKFALRPELESLSEKAKDIKSEADAMQVKYAVWFDYIMMLQKHLIQLNGVGVDEVLAPSQFELDVQAAGSELKKAEAELERAEKAAEEARKILHDKMSQKGPPALSIEDITAKLSTADSESDWPGLFPWMKRAVYGQTDKEKNREEKRRQERLRADAEAIHILMEEERQNHEMARQQAKAELDAAREHANEVEGKLREAQNLHRIKGEHLFKSRGVMEVAKKNLELLGRKDVDMDAISDIVNTSTIELSNLKSHVDDLSVFFGGLSRLVDDTIKLPLASFLRTLEAGVRANDSAHGKTELKFGSAKRQILINMFEIQGRLSAIAGISAVYGDVSSNFIRPGIGRMESLALARPAEYEKRRKEFDEWCDDAQAKIEVLAMQGCDTVNQGVADSIQAVVSRVVEDDGYLIEHSIASQGTLSL